MKRIKLIAVFAVLGSVTLITAISGGYRSNAQTDDVLSSISSYKTWAKVTKEPIVVKFDIGDVGL